MQCSVQSTSNFLRQNFLNHIDIKPENINALDGSIPKDELESYCQEYENKIRKNGGIDIMILGLGKAG
jgi:glucosamine-6-phosphate deaminase